MREIRQSGSEGGVAVTRHPYPYELAAGSEVSAPDRLAVVVADAAAIYPVRIDPTFSDANWTSLGGLPGANASVNASVVDGAGNLYVAGGFTVIGTVAANCIAKWDGTSWSALGSGMVGSVYALAVSGSTLYAGGNFTVVGGSSASAALAKWDGIAWSALGSGVSGQVYSLAVSGSTLYAGGTFTTAGGVSANYIAEWNGTTWSSLGSGMGAMVRSLVVSGTTLYAGGDFTTAGGSTIYRIAQWDGSAWSALGPGLYGTINSMAVSGSRLYVGGYITKTQGGVNGSLNNVVQWDGTTWSSLGGGVDNTVSALVVSGGDLYVAGQFTTAGTSAINRVAKWDGTAWSALGSGVNSSVFGMAIFGTNLYVVGNFSMAGGTGVIGVAGWNGSAWSALGSGMNDQVSALAVSGTNLYVGGAFISAGQTNANYIASWNGIAWSPLGAGLGSGVKALAVSGTNLYAGGGFTTAGGIAANYIAKWNGSTWSALGSGMNGSVTALAVSGTNLYAGGYFTTAGGLVASNVACWNGSTWSALGLGMRGPAIFSSSYVLSLAVSGTNLYAGGYFTTAGGLAVSNVACWNGSAWSALGLGMNNYGYVQALAVSGTRLYAGGTFITAGGIDAKYIASWDGSAWSPLGSGMSGEFGSGPVYALALSGTTLYAGGGFTNAGGTSANYLARWNGSAWTALGSGANAAVKALSVSGSNLYAGGNFSIVGGRVSGYASRATIPATTIMLASSGNPATVGESLTFTATVSPVTATGTVTFYDGAATLGAGALSGGVATLVTSGLAVGSHSITAEYGGDADLNGSRSTPVEQAVTVPKANPDVTTWPTAGSIIYGQTLAGSTLTGGASTPVGSFAWTTPATAPGAGSAPQSVTFTPDDTANYNTTNWTVGVTVDKATPSVTTWPGAGTLIQGNALSTVPLSGGSASVGGAFAFTLPESLPPVGTNLQSVTFTATDGANYNTVTGSVAVTVVRLPAATTLAATAVLGTEATLNGSINPGGFADAFFQYGKGTNTEPVVSTLAGSSSGYAKGTGAAAQFAAPYAVARDGSGNVYVADSSNHRIRKVTPGGVVTTLAGTNTAGYADGTAGAAQFNGPYGVAVDGAGNVYVADRFNNCIRKVTPDGVVSTLAGQTTAGLADGNGAAASFSSPTGVAVDTSGNVYVADYSNNRIRKVTPTGEVTTLAGNYRGYVDGTGAAALFDGPYGVAVDGAGNAYVADQNNHCIRKITLAGEVTTLAGLGGTSGYAEGNGAAAKFNYPRGVVVDSAGSVYVADTYNHRIRKITSARDVTTVAGQGSSGFREGSGSVAKFFLPAGVAVDGNGNLYVGDTIHLRIICAT